MQIEDRGHRRFLLDLNQTAFVLQKFATPMYGELEERFGKLGSVGLEEALGNFYVLLEKRCRLGIADDDRDVEINFGFCEERPMLLDPGRLFFDERLRTPEGFHIEMLAATKKLRRYLAQKHPEEALFLERKLSAELLDDLDRST